MSEFPSFFFFCGDVFCDFRNLVTSGIIGWHGMVRLLIGYHWMVEEDLKVFSEPWYVLEPFLHVLGPTLALPLGEENGQQILSRPHPPTLLQRFHHKSNRLISLGHSQTAMWIVKTLSQGHFFGFLSYAG